MVSAGVAAPANAQTPSFTLLGISQGSVASRGTGISADGNVASGYSDGIGQPGFLWTRGAGRNDFGLASPGTMAAYGISGDGRFAVGGWGPGSPIGSAFRWSQTTGYQDLSPGEIALSEAVDASFDGSVVVGMSRATSGGLQRPFRWTEAGGFQVLGTNVEGSARAVSGNGNVIVGATSNSAFVWTQAGGVQFLPSVTGAGLALARGVNFDGTIIVGGSGPGAATGTMWINGVPQALANSVPNSSFTAYGVSDDGSVVCGTINAGIGGEFAGVWTPATGIVLLSEYLVANGVVVPSGVTLRNSTGVSSDGRSFVGDASFSPGFQAYVATVPGPGTLALMGVGWLFAARRRRPSLRGAS